MYSWTSNYWGVIYSLLSSTNDDNIEETKNTIDILCNRMPCGKCVKHYIDYIGKNSMKNIKNQKDLAFWLKDYHNSTKKKNEQKNEQTNEQKNEQKKVVKKGCCRKYEKPKNKMMYF